MSPIESGPVPRKKRLHLGAFLSADQLKATYPHAVSLEIEKYLGWYKVQKVYMAAHLYVAIPCLHACLHLHHS